MQTEETGKRIKVAGVINAPAHSATVRDLASSLSHEFGGCTVLPGGFGYWVGPAGNLMSEEATIVEVSFPMVGDWTDRDLVLWVRQAMAEAQEEARGTWVHIEVSTFSAAHTHVDHNLVEDMFRNRPGDALSAMIE